MTSKAGHTFTAGPCEFHTQPYDCRSGNGLDHSIMDDGVVVVFVVAPGHANEAFQKRGHFIAEAFTVAHETGMTPRQLAERCAKLEAFAQAVIEADQEGHMMPTWMVRDARAAIAKATAGGAV